MNSLTKYLKDNDESQQCFAERVGIHQSTVSRILNNTFRPSPELALKIEQATGGQVTRMEILYPQSQ